MAVVHQVVVRFGKAFEMIAMPAKNAKHTVPTTSVLAG
jgi:hypothetical protein